VETPGRRALRIASRALRSVVCISILLDYCGQDFATLKLVFEDVKKTQEPSGDIHHPPLSPLLIPRSGRCQIDFHTTNSSDARQIYPADIQRN
jgi:hypothetical protein